VLLIVDWEIARVFLTVADDISLFLGKVCRTCWVLAVLLACRRRKFAAQHDLTTRQVANVKNSPFRTRRDLVKVFSAFLAEVLVGAGFLLHDTNTATMLPDLADVALDKQTT
jgi:hypothetical protein